MSYRAELVEKLADFESQNNVNQFTYKGLEIWPILRFMIAQEIENEWLSEGRHTPSWLFQYKNDAMTLHKIFTKQAATKSSSSEQLIWNALGATNQFFSDSDILFISRPERHFQFDNGLLTCGHEDSLQSILSDHEKCKKYEQYNSRLSDSLPRKIQPTYFGVFERSQYDDENIDNVFPEYEDNIDLIKEIRKEFKVKSLVKGLIYKKVRTIEKHSYVYRHLLDKLKPKSVFFGLYYADETLGCILACKTLNIPSVEIQHGFVGTHQWFQTKWAAVPQGGYALLPDFFWVWDEHTKKETVASFKNSDHRVILGGNPKRAEREKKPRKLYSFAERNFLQQLSNKKKTILVALQYVELMPEVILQAIQKAPQSWEWLLRLHPMSKPIVPIFTEQIRRAGMSNVDVALNNSMDDLDLLAVCDHVVTEYSTFALDAKEFGIPVTITNPNGIELFGSWGVSTDEFVNDPEDLIERIKTTAKAKVKRKSDLSLALAAKDEIAKQWEIRLEKGLQCRSKMLDEKYFHDWSSIHESPNQINDQTFIDRDWYEERVRVSSVSQSSNGRHVEAANLRETFVTMFKSILKPFKKS